MKRVIVGLLLFCGVVLAPGAEGAPKHALAKMAKALAVTAPKAVVTHAAVPLKVTIGSVMFAVESGVDVVHLATDVLDKGVAAEGWKKNPFHYPNIVVAKADSGLEMAEDYFFGSHN